MTCRVWLTLIVLSFPDLIRSNVHCSILQKLQLFSRRRFLVPWYYAACKLEHCFRDPDPCRRNTTIAQSKRLVITAENDSKISRKHGSLRKCLHAFSVLTKSDSSHCVHLVDRPHLKRLEILSRNILGATELPIIKWRAREPRFCK